MGPATTKMNVKMLFMKKTFGNCNLDGKQGNYKQRERNLKKNDILASSRKI